MALIIYRTCMMPHGNLLHDVTHHVMVCLWWAWGSRCLCKLIHCGWWGSRLTKSFEGQLTPIGFNKINVGSLMLIVESYRLKNTCCRVVCYVCVITMNRSCRHYKFLAPWYKFCCLTLALMGLVKIQPHKFIVNSMQVNLNNAHQGSLAPMHTFNYLKKSIFGLHVRV